MARINWSEHAHLLGTAPDGVIAERIGVTRVAVQYQRVRREIPAFRKRRIPRGVTVSLVLDLAVYDALKASAAKNGRSMSRTASGILRKTLVA